MKLTLTLLCSPVALLAASGPGYLGRRPDVHKGSVLRQRRSLEKQALGMSQNPVPIVQQHRRPTDAPEAPQSRGFQLPIIRRYVDSCPWAGARDGVLPPEAVPLWRSCRSGAQPSLCQAMPERRHQWRA